MKNTILSLIALASISLFLASCSSGPGGQNALPTSVQAGKIDLTARRALNRLYKTNPGALALSQKAKGVLVFPTITKGGFVFGASGGDGALYERGKPTGFYRSLSASWGLQAGLQKYSYALFLMDDNAINALNRSGGWDLGASPNIVIIDQGASEELSTTTSHRGTYIITFGHQGLMAGIDIHGTKITRLNIR